MTNRNAVFTFSQSVTKLIMLWNSNKSEDDALYSAIVFADKNYSIREDIYLSLPVKFENGAYAFSNSYKVGRQTVNVISEIIKVRI